MPVDLRPARPGDEELLFEWANDPDTRAASFASAPIPWPTHVAWFERRVADPDTRLWIAQQDGVPVAQIRFERAGVVWLAAVVVAPDHRGRGLAASVIAAGTSELHRHTAEPAVALVKLGNDASVRAFLAAGYRDEGIDATHPHRPRRLVALPDAGEGVVPGR